MVSSPRLGTIALVQERVNSSLGGLASRRDEVNQRCRTVLQSKAGGLLRNSQPNSPRPVIAHATCNLTNQCRSGRLRFALRARTERSDLPQSPYFSNRCTRYTSGGNNDCPGRGPWTDTATARALRGIQPDGADPAAPMFGLTGETLANRVSAAARAAGLGDRFSGHSGRIGMARRMVAAGAPTAAVQNQGELGGLSNLTELVLYGNQLTGEIPPALGRLSNLTELVLYGNQLTGEIPPELGGLSNLARLWLSSNQLTGCIPEGLRDIAENDLVELNLPDCGAATPGESDGHAREGPRRSDRPLQRHRRPELGKKQ